MNKVFLIASFLMLAVSGIQAQLMSVDTLDALAPVDADIPADVKLDDAAAAVPSVDVPAS